MSKFLLITTTIGAMLGGAAHASPAQAGPATPPVAHLDTATDIYFGTALPDPYRWMEAEPEPEFRAYLQLQTDFTRGMLDRIAGRAAMARDVAAVDGLTTRISSMTMDGDALFYLKRAPGDDIAKLVLRDTKGTETVLVDPASLGAAGHHVEIDQFAPSMDGAYVVYGLSTGGSENSVLHIMKVPGRTDVAETIDRAQFANVSWAPDSTGFYYSRLPKQTDTTPAAERYNHLSVYFHEVGTNPAGDRLELNGDKLPFRFNAAQAFPLILITPQSDYALAVISNGVSPEVAIYAAHLGELAMRPIPWTRIATQEDGVTQLAIRGSLIFLLTHKDAPRYSVAVGDLADGTAFSTRTVIPQGDGVITGITAAADALYVSIRHGVDSRVERLDYNQAKPDELRLPFPGTVDAANGGLVADPRLPGAVFSLEAWTRQPVWLRYDAGKQALTDLGLGEKFPKDLTPYKVTETQAAAKDGTSIPLSVISRSDVLPDHHRPTLVDGYGAYGIAYDPGFIASMLPWLDRGGVFAVCHVRGGGEFGEPWHNGGKLATKQNTVTDFLACARTLIDLGYTDHAHLAGTGTSAGGMTIGGAITADPAMFAAALIRVGATDALRNELQPSGPANIPEFGSVKDPAQFASLYAMDAYQHVKQGTAYPAILLTGGFEDPRVAVWEPAKMAARLQAATSSGKPILLRVEFDAGHGIGSTRAQRDAEQADELAFLLWQMNTPGFELGPPPKPIPAHKKPRKK